MNAIDLVLWIDIMRYKCEHWNDKISRRSQYFFSRVSTALATHLYEKYRTVCFLSDPELVQIGGFMVDAMVRG